MRHDNAILPSSSDALPNQLTVGFGHIEAVLTENRFDFEIEPDIRAAQQVSHLGRADFVFAFGIEIDLVDRAAGCEEFYFHQTSCSETGGPCPVGLNRK